MKATDQIKRAAFSKTLDYFLKDPETNTVKIMDLLDKVAPADLFPSQRTAFRNAIDQQNNWYQLIMKIMDLNPAVRDRLVKTFLIDGNLMAWPKQEAMPREVPVQHPVGRPDGSHQRLQPALHRLLGRRVRPQGEPFVRGAGLRHPNRARSWAPTCTSTRAASRSCASATSIALCEKHPDCTFLSFTNATLIDEDFCQDMLRVANFVPAISVEGFEEATDGRRGEGTYAKVATAMGLLREHGLPFGVSCCYTSAQRRVHRVRRVLRLAHRPGRTVLLDLLVLPRGREFASRAHGHGRATRAPLPLRARHAQHEAAVHA